MVINSNNSPFLQYASLEFYQDKQASNESLERQNDIQKNVVSLDRFEKSAAATVQELREVADMPLYNPEKSKYVSLPTKKYIDAVIKESIDQIKRGENIEENKNIIKIFSGILHEDPLNLLNSHLV